MGGDRAAGEDDCDDVNQYAPLGVFGRHDAAGAAEYVVMHDARTRAGMFPGRRRAWEVAESDRRAVDYGVNRELAAPSEVLIARRCGRSGDSCPAAGAVLEPGG